MLRSLRPLLAAGLVAAGLLAAAPAPLAQDILPITRGFYLPADVPCAEASNATLLLYTGDGFNFSQAACTATDVTQDGATFSIHETCTEIQGGDEFASDYRAIVTDARHLTIDTGYNSTAYHFCPQAELPEPWRDNDLSWLDEQP